MSIRTLTRKRRRTNTSDISHHTNSINLSSDVTFLIGYVNSKNILLRLLLFEQITHLSFSELDRRSESIGWMEVLIGLRNSLKLDEKSKPKRFIFNRSIQEYLTNAENFNNQIKELNENMKKQLSNIITPEQTCQGRLETIDDLFNEINIWRELQCSRRLFYTDYSQRFSFILLQKCITDHFLNLLQAPYQNVEALKEVFSHCLVIVVQPSGTDCPAVTKYEKVGKEYLAKIKTRIICLLDPNRVKNHLGLSDVGVTLHLKDQTIDPKGDVQSPLSWKTRTVQYDGNQERTFWYVEFDENDPLKLTKKNPNGKLSYNNALCQLKFETKFKLIETDIETLLQFNSECFGLCSHAKFSPKYLTRVFLEEVKKNYGNDNGIPMTALESYIHDFHECISGVSPKRHTLDFILGELMKVDTDFYKCVASTNEPIVFFNIDKFEGTLEKFFSQMIFMDSHPYLSLMYHDNLFLGICTNQVDDELNSNTSGGYQFIMRFALSTEQERSENPSIIIAVHDNILKKSLITHDYLVSDMSTCICRGPNFRQYYDPDLNRDNLIQVNNKITYYPLNAILPNIMLNNPTQPHHPLNEQQTWPYSIHPSDQFTVHEDLNVDLVASLQEYDARLYISK